MKVAKIGMFIALAMALSWAERFLFPVVIAPGFKIGLANIITIIVLVLYGVKSAFSVVIIRSLLSALLFAGFSSLPYSLFGGVAALLSMILISKVKGITFVGIAVTGAFFHNLGQVTVAAIIMSNIYIFTYLGVLGIASVVVGLFTGVISGICIKRFKKYEKGAEIWSIK